MKWIQRACRIVLLSFCASNPVTAFVFLGYAIHRQRALVFGDRQAAHLVRNPDNAKVLARWFGSLWTNFKTGIHTAFASAMLVLPSAVLMLTSWYAGWNNSFNKGYEYAFVGPVTGLAGLFLAMLTMTYLPVAQARFATTRQWRDLYDWHTNLQIIVCHPFRLFVHAFLGAMIGGILLFARGMPTFFGGNIAPDANPAGLLTFWFLIIGLVFVPLYLVFKDTSAKSYHSGLTRALTKRFLNVDDLHPDEQLLSHRTPLDGANEGEGLRYRPLSRIRVFFTLLVAAILWFPAFAMLYMQQFLNYLGAWGWLNYPLVWVPLIAYGPG
ncbi:MAG: hypothetical protein AAF525_12810 [Pseudomonadota bacterium]